MLEEVKSSIPGILAYKLTCDGCGRPLGEDEFGTEERLKSLGWHIDTMAHEAKIGAQICPYCREKFYPTQESISTLEYDKRILKDRGLKIYHVPVSEYYESDWTPKVNEIYAEALRRCYGYESPLHFWFAHIVWEDNNMNDSDINFCLSNLPSERLTESYTERDFESVKWSLEEVLKIPQDKRLIENSR